MLALQTILEVAIRQAAESGLAAGQESSTLLILVTRTQGQMISSLGAGIRWAATS